MLQSLFLTVRFHDGRYHGVPDWPPSPARLFQSLVAGAARGSALASTDVAALHWLETLNAPYVAAPAARRGAFFTNFVPNNDLDFVGGHPSRIAEIRTAKLIGPHLFDAEMPLLYSWLFSPSTATDHHAQRICEIAQQVYQLGRGVDMAWAIGELVSAEEAEARLAAHQGPVHNPADGRGGAEFACPIPGSLDSLIERYTAGRKRFAPIIEPAPTAMEPGRTKVTGTSFTQSPRSRFRKVAYDCPTTFLLFDLSGAKAPWAQSRIAELVEAIRDAAAVKLKAAYAGAGLVSEEACVEPVLVGRGATNADKASRIRIIPLPSIGSLHVTSAIRRVLVEAPPNCPLPSDDIAWTFSGLCAEKLDPESGEVSDIWRLIPADDRKMLVHYGVEAPSGAPLWRSVTPLALSDRARRHRIEPDRKQQEAKSGLERAGEETSAAAAVVAALRHAGVPATARAIRVQREPFAARGMRSEAFSPGTRFAKEQLWHVELQLDHSVRGPLLLGDGRYLGIGLMAPVNAENGVLAFRIVEGLDASADFASATHALRRAVMARARTYLEVVRGLRSSEALPAFFTGHEPNGSVARSGGHAHIAHVLDRQNGRLLVIAPHVVERRKSTSAERKHLSVLAAALMDLDELRAGRAGLLKLKPDCIDAEVSQLIRPSQVWQNVTPYLVNRHRKLGNAAAALSADVSESCRLLGLPSVRVTVLEMNAAAGRGLSGWIRLVFSHAVDGPIIIGRDRHFGGGLFVGTHHGGEADRPLS